MQRSRRKNLILIGLSLLLSTSAAKGDEFVFAFEGEARYDDNLFRSFVNPTSDTLLYARPSFTLRKRTGPFLYDLEYRPVYEGYVTHSDFNNWAHRLNVNLNYHATTATEFFLRNRTFQGDTVDGDITDPEGGGDINRGLRQARVENRFTVGVNQRFAQGLSLSGTVSYFFVDYTEGNSRNASTISANMRLSRALSPRTQVGLSCAVSQQDFEEFRGVPETWSRYYNLGLFLSHTFAPGLTFSMDVGPAYIEQKPQELSTNLYGTVTNALPTVRVVGVDGFFPYAFSSCPSALGYDLFPCTQPTGVYPIGTHPGLAFPLTADEVDQFGTMTYRVTGEVPEQSNTTSTYFGTIRLAKAWPRASASLGFTRRQSASAGIGSSTVNDRLVGSVSWSFWRKWSASLFLSASQFESASESLVPTRIVSGTNVPLVPSGIPTDPPVAEFTGQYIYVKTDALQDFVQYSGQLRVDYRMSRQLAFFGAASFTDQVNNSVFQTRSDYDRFYASLGFRYTFDAIHY